MSIYSPYDVYPDYFDEEPTSFCDVCAYDCSETGICLALEAIYNE